MSFAGPANFRASAARALADEPLQRELGKFSRGFQVRRVEAASRLPEFEALRDRARDIKNHCLAHLDFYLERFEENCRAAGGEVHWCATAEDARQAILAICRRLGAKTMAKGKSMVSEEVGLNEFLAENGVRAVETDLGEYILQLRGESPSHIVAPAIHVATEQWTEAFRAAHTDRPADRSLSDGSEIMAEARAVLRQQFLDADVGLTGANFLIAETGSSVIFTNEGNGDLSQTLPRAHIVIAGIEKVIPTLEDLSVFMRVLPRSATGQELTVYTTLSTGPRRAEDLDGPEEYHVVLLDNGRADMLGSEFQDMLRCIRCAACMNACPVYKQIGGHAYGWGLSGADGRGADAGPARRRGSGAPAQRLYLLRQVRRGVPGPHPLAAHDAALARARILPPPQPGQIPLRAGHMGLLRLVSGALPALLRHRRTGSGPEEALAAAAACRWVDRHARLPGVGGAQLHEPLAGGAEALRPWRRGRPFMNASWRRKARRPSRSASTSAG